MWKLFLPVTSDRQPADTLTCRACLVPSSLFVYCNNSSTRLHNLPQSLHSQCISSTFTVCAIVFSLLLARTGHGQDRDNGKFQLYTSLWLWRPLIDILVADTSQDTMEFYFIANICWHIILGSPAAGPPYSIPVFMNHVNCSSTVVHLKFELSGR